MRRGGKTTALSLRVTPAIRKMVEDFQRSRRLETISHAVAILIEDGVAANK